MESIINKLNQAKQRSGIEDNVEGLLHSESKKK
jgi:hypothetical protein